MERGEEEGAEIRQGLIKILAYKRMCWPANTVGAFFIALLVFDMVQKNYKDLPLHALYGIVLTFLFWLLCYLVGDTVSGGILVIPMVFLIVFLFSIWFIIESIKNRGCCMNCPGECGSTCKKGRIVKKGTAPLAADTESLLARFNIVGASAGATTTTTTTSSSNPFARIFGNLSASTKCPKMLTATPVS
jgi:hypothetical protein